MRAHFSKVLYKQAPVQSDAVWNGVIEPDAEWAFVDFFTTQIDHSLFFIHRNRGVFHQTMQDIGGHTLICIPIARSVFDSGEEEVGCFHRSTVG